MYVRIYGKYTYAYGHKHKCVQRSYYTTVDGNQLIPFLMSVYYVAFIRFLCVYLYGYDSSVYVTTMYSRDNRPPSRGISDITRDRVRELYFFYRRVNRLYMYVYKYRIKSRRNPITRSHVGFLTERKMYWFYCGVCFRHPPPHVYERLFCQKFRSDFQV